MEKKIIRTNNAPEPIGPYNQAIAFGNMLFISGQIPIDPVNGELIMDNVKAQANQVMKNLEAVLKEASMDFSNALKTTIFLTDMADFVNVNDIYRGYFAEGQAPARETVQVSGLPKGVNVEISMIAAK